MTTSGIRRPNYGRFEKGKVRSTYKWQARMIGVMDVKEVREICMHRRKWRSIVSTYPDSKICVCILFSLVLVERMPITWGSNYSLLFIDNPVGSGFSFTEVPGQYVTNEDMVSKVTYIFFLFYISSYIMYEHNLIQRIVKS